MIYNNKEIATKTIGTFFEPKTKTKILSRNCFFIDIETIRGYEKYEDMSVDLQRRWNNKVDNWIKFADNSKAKLIDAIFEDFEKSKENIFDQSLLFDIYQKNKESNYAKEYAKVAGLYPEYGQIVCISLGYYKDDGEVQKISFVGDEYNLLLNFQSVIQKLYDKYSKDRGNMWLVGHNISFFDIPYLTKRMAIKGLAVPQFINLAFLEKWNKRIIDTSSEWRAGSTTGDATLETLTIILGLDNPKMGLKGEEMSDYYYSDSRDINKIVEYCENDIEAVIQLFNYLQNLQFAVQ